MKKARPKLYTLFIRVPDGTGSLKLFPETDQQPNGHCIFKFRVMTYGEALTQVRKFEELGHSVWLWHGQSDYKCAYQSKDTGKSAVYDGAVVDWVTS